MTTTTQVQVVTPDGWDDLAALFGSNGAYANCWCTWWRLSSSEFDGCRPYERRAVLEDLVCTDRQPGLLAYRAGRPIGWIAVAPRAEYPRLNRSPHTRPVDDLPVWSVTCFWVPRSHRGTGLATELLAGAVAHAERQGAVAIEGYPVDPAVRTVSADQAFTGTVELFRRAGFTEIARRAPKARAVMRRDLS